MPALVVLCLLSGTAVTVACGGGDDDAKSEAKPSGTATAAATCENVCAAYATCGKHPDCSTACAGYAQSGRSCVISAENCSAIDACDSLLVPDTSNPGGNSAPQDCTKEPYVVRNILETSACPKPQCRVGSLDSASTSSPAAVCTSTPLLEQEDGGAYRYVCPAGYEADSAYAASVKDRPNATCRKTCTTVADCGRSFYSTCRPSEFGPGDAGARPLLCF